MQKIERRTMLKTIGGASLISIVPYFEKRLGWNFFSKQTTKTINTDILVVGGGTSGTIAAIQSARAGCDTVLVENGSQLGGTITTGGVAFPGLFYAWGKQIIGGIGWDLVNEAVDLNDGSLPDFSIPYGTSHPKHQVSLNGYLYAILSEEKCLEAGIQIRYYETPVDIHFNGNVWQVEIVGKGTHVRVNANQVIDCTGNAYVTALAGFKVLRGEEIQPGSLMFQIGGYDLEKLDLEYIKERYQDAIERGELVREEFRNNIVGLLRSLGNNISHITDADSTTSETHTITNIRGRKSLLDTLRFLRTLPGLEKTHIISMQPETGIRETYRIDGEYKITHEDYITGKVFDDAVSYSFYPIDLHDKHGVVPRYLTKNTVATIPLRALIPRNSKNFLVAGRCISSDRLANSALRVQASCMSMGQAAGAAAVLAFRNNTTPQKVPTHEIRSLIEKYGGIVPK
jgi:hypothetical protein